MKNSEREFVHVLDFCCQSEKCRKHTKKIFICSTASHSSPSSTTIRTRKKSRTSSAGGDSLAATRTAGDGFESKSRGRSTKCNVRLLSGNLKNSRKAAKSGRSLRPNFGSLRNAVVLAPFYTLKKCFQTKLIDLYSYEKMKKINHKTKLAKKRNMSFEYDIIELKPPSPPVKKEEKAAKKPKEKSRSASYCQCKKDNSKEGKRLDRSCSKKVKKPNGGEHFTSRVPHFSEPLKAKRRKLNPGVVTAATAKGCLPAGIDFYAPGDRFPFSEANQSFSVVSSSKSDSWETYSNSPSCKEEHVQGSLAISTTSFDSYLEHFDKGSLHYSEPNSKNKGETKSRRDQERIDADILPKPTARNLIMPGENKNSDGEIVDFMDREPQTQMISSLESNPHWQPLQRQSRTKGKKPETESAAGYYLRSHSSSKEKHQTEGSRTFGSTGRQECRAPCENAFHKSKAFRIEVGTQVEGDGLKEVPGRLSSTSSKTGPQGPTLGALCEDDPREGIPEKSLCDSKSQPSDQQGQSPPRELAPDLEASGENLHPPRIDSAENEPGFFEGELPEAGLSILGEHSDRTPMDLMHERMQHQTDSHQPQDKETDYIFGARSSANRLGESCEFSFGLKWVFSDDED